MYDLARLARITSAVKKKKKPCVCKKKVFFFYIKKATSAIGRHRARRVDHLPGSRILVEQPGVEGAGAPATAAAMVHTILPDVRL